MEHYLPLSLYFCFELNFFRMVLLSSFNNSNTHGKFDISWNNLVRAQFLYTKANYNINIYVFYEKVDISLHLLFLYSKSWGVWMLFWIHRKCKFTNVLLRSHLNCNFFEHELIKIISEYFTWNLIYLLFQYPRLIFIVFCKLCILIFHQYF